VKEGGGAAVVFVGGLLAARIGGGGGGGRLFTALTSSSAGFGAWSSSSISGLLNLAILFPLLFNFLQVLQEHFHKDVTFKRIKILNICN
jgi:tetrahydromethanopterin S-methyltransferase subunit D